MLMEDEQKVENYLMNIGYHRLSAYIYPFYKNPKEDLLLKVGTTFKQALTLYRFDKKLRILLFKMITEVLSFGNLNYIYSNIASNKLMKRIAGYFGLKPQVFTSWLTVLANLRNMCCHHARIWNRDFMLNPAEPRKMSNTWIDTSKIDKKRIFYRLCIIRYFLASISPNNNFNEKVANLLNCFPSIDITAMGFCNGWKHERLWN